MAKVPVSIASDLSSGRNAHVVDAYAPPMPDFFDSSAPMDWVIGKYMGKHSLATERPVLHKGQAIVLDTHDLGPLLPHAPCGAPQHLLKASRKTIFSASTVLARAKPVACADATHPLMLCGDIAKPNGFNDTNSQHSVFVGTTSLDEFKGRAEILKSELVDAISFGIGGAATDPGSIAADVLGVDPVKITVNAVGSLVQSIAVSRASGWKEPISIKMDAGGGFGSRNMELSYKPDTKQWSGKDSENTLGMKTEREWTPEQGVTQKSNDSPGGEMKQDDPQAKSWGDLPGDWKGAAL